MSYTITTIGDLLSRVNDSLFIPGIQRPYVWTQEQIVRLFDSLMRRYPIGTLLIWQLPQGRQGDWEIYRFIENFREGDIHNDRVDSNPEQSYKLVLDGQQRLTSLLLGLAGTYTVKRSNMRRTTIGAWQEKALHIDLAHAPSDEDAVDEQDNPLAEHYHFKFFNVDERPAKTKDELWFELAFIMDAKNEQALEELKSNWVNHNLTLSEAHKAAASDNLQRLWEMVWRDQSIAYFTEISDSYDRVLDIFIRANDGGTKLSRSDLLMSVITLRWEQFNAREETEFLINELTDLIKPQRKLTREFLLRSALFLNDLDFTIQVKNFTPGNIAKLESSWEQTKRALLFTAQWLKTHGLYAELLGSNNVLMLLAYYFNSAGLSTTNVQASDENDENIRGWIITLLYQQLLSTQTNATLSAFRKAIKEQHKDRVNFPVRDVMAGFRRNGRNMGFDAEWTKKLCNEGLDNVQTEKLLSLLYRQDIAGSHLRVVSAVQSRFFMPEELRRAGVPDSLAPTYKNYNNRLVLAVALSEAELTKYYALPFDIWAQTLTPAQLDWHCLPGDLSLYNVHQIPKLANARFKLILAKLLKHYPIPTPQSTEALEPLAAAH